MRDNFFCSIVPTRNRIVSRGSFTGVRTGVVRLTGGGRPIIHGRVTGTSTLTRFGTSNRRCGYRRVRRSLRSNAVAACARNGFASLYHNPRLLGANLVGTIGVADITNTF